MENAFKTDGKMHKTLLQFLPPLQMNFEQFFTGGRFILPIRAGGN